MLSHFNLVKDQESDVNPILAVTPIEKRLRLYTQYPGNYNSFRDMADDLLRIQQMGFKQVWVNPFYTPCQKNSIEPEKIRCPYAMQDHTQLNPEFGSSFEDVTNYTKQAKSLGLVPVFDLVALHVAVDHPFVTGDKSLINQGIDTSKWFKRHPNGKLMIKGLDENHKPTASKNPWSDVAAFDFDNPTTRDQIINYFLKPFIEFNIKTLGFQGARLDAVGRIPREVHEQLLNYIKDCCKKYHKREAYLVAETVGTEFVHKDMERVSGLATHTMNSSFWMPGPEGRDKNSYDLWMQDSYDDKENKGNWYNHTKGILQNAAPTAGHSGSHDEERYPHILEKFGIHDKTVIKQRMCELIMVSAFGSDGGHILSYGDEFGVKTQVNLNHRKVIDLMHEKQFDLTPEVTAINKIVAQLPEPTNPEWTQRVFCSKYPELVIFIVHQGSGFDGKSHVIIGNSYNDEDKNIEVTQTMLNEILTANGRNKEAHQRKLPESIYLCGKIKPASDLTPKVFCVNIEGKPKPKQIINLQ